ncbi:O-antigen ligase family protein [Marinobacter koreensis]|uniref:O-antigen ligase family protein n=1 Tax=Marinobacter koreensis TaxID=335974 RepID=A0ABW0RPN9_9GAMM|nr:O-antigen ligase family protein [Marinobacter koreensis]MCK7549779.1 O-antigen ligase family protein [Marinobacter koreensis]
MSSGAALLALALIFRSDFNFPGRLCSQYKAPIILLFTTFFIAIVFSTLPSKGLKPLYDLLRAFTLLLTFSYLGKNFHSASILRGTSMVSVIFLTAIFLYLLWNSKSVDFAVQSNNWPKIFGLSYSRNIIATEIAIASIPLICILLDRKIYLTKTETYIYSTGLTIYCIILILSLSRGTLLAIAVTAFSAGMIFQRKKLITLIFLFIFLLLFAGNLISDNFILHSIFSGIYRGGDILSGRNAIYSATLDFIAQKPWFGYGPGTFKHLNVVDHFLHPHSMYLELVFSFGLLGSAALISSILWIYIRASRTLEKDDPLVKFSILLLIFFTTRGIFDIHLFVYEPWAIVFIALGAFCGKNAPQNRPHKERTPYY